MAAGGVVAVHTLDQSGSATTAYIHADNLGSSDTIFLEVVGYEPLKRRAEALRARISSDHHAAQFLPKRHGGERGQVETSRIKRTRS
jgi:hypothetical protein